MSMPKFTGQILCWGAALCMSVGCTTMPLIGTPERREMTGLEEMSFEFIRGEWGAPDAEQQSGEKKIVHYKNVRSEDSDPISGQVTYKLCTLRLELDKAELVSSWEYENCQAVK